MTDKLLFDVRDRIATITYNNPDRLNAFTHEMLTGYLDRLEECRTRDDIWAVIVTAAGRGFCAGGDTRQMGSDLPPTPLEIKSGLWDLIQKISLKIREIDKPVIAAVNGVAVGAGMDMSLHADLRFAAESARFAETYVRVGLVPGNGGAWFLPRIVGVPKALELLWSADFLSAQEAMEIGLVNKVFPDDELQAGTRAYVEKLVNSSPISIRLIKRAMYAGLDMDLRSALDMVSSHMVLARSSDDHKEAIAAWAREAGRELQQPLTDRMPYIAASSPDCAAKIDV